MSATTPADALYSLTETRHRLHVALKRATSNAEWASIEAAGRAVLDEIGKRRHRRLILDLSELEYIGSSTIAFLMRIWKHVHEFKGEMLVVIADERVFEIIKLSGLTKVWTIFDTLEEADQHLNDQRRVGRNIAPLLCVLGLFSLVVAVGLCALQWVLDEPPGRLLVITQIALGSLGAVLQFWAATLFQSSGMRWVAVLLALLGCGAAGEAGVRLSNSRAETPPAAHDDEPRNAEGNQADAKPGDAAANESKPVDSKPEETKPGDAKPDDANAPAGDEPVKDDAASTESETNDTTKD